MTSASQRINLYHLHVASEAGASGRAPRRRLTGMAAAVVALVLGLTGLVVCVTGAALQVLPRRFTAAQQQSIMNWEVAARWRDLSAGSIFHASVGYQPPPSLLDDGTGTSLSLTARRIGIAPQVSCGAGLDVSAAAVLVRHGCQALLRATYTDTTDSYVVTVGVAVLRGAAQAHAAQAQLPGAGGSARREPGVRTVSFAGTAAARFTDARRQLSASFSAGPYVLLYTVGYAGERPVLPVTGDQYVTSEMTSLASGVARSVATVLATPPKAPHCPGAPGC